jgi:DNA-binding XRE family transcriptional regulator
MQTTSFTARYEMTSVRGCDLGEMPRGVRQVPSEDVALRIGANIRRERRQAGMTQEELADRAGLHRTAVGLLERGHRMARADTLLQLAGALSISPAAFFHGIYWTPVEQPVERQGGAFGFETPLRRAAE